LEIFDSELSVVSGGLAVDSAVFDLFESQVVVKDVEKTGHLREDEDSISLVKKLFEE
jgi:hypothetical protein